MKCRSTFLHIIKFAHCRFLEPLNRWIFRQLTSTQSNSKASYTWSKRVAILLRIWDPDQKDYPMGHFWVSKSLRIWIMCHLSLKKVSYHCFRTGLKNMRMGQKMSLLFHKKFFIENWDVLIDGLEYGSIVGYLKWSKSKKRSKNSPDQLFHNFIASKPHHNLYSLQKCWMTGFEGLKLLKGRSDMQQEFKDLSCL